MAEAPSKLVTIGLSPFLISLGMVAGVFVARWTVPMALKGTSYIWADLREKPHLISWAILAGILWAIANTLTVFAIRDVGLSVAFPLWNTNSLVGLFWGWLLFKELRGAGGGQKVKVLGGAAAIVVGACVLAWATASRQAHSTAAPMAGILAAIGAGVLWGTMYIPYRKAYISGMNPLSFVTVFTFGELGAAIILAATLGGDGQSIMAALDRARPVLFWLFLGGFCWVIGDLFQQYAAKYIGIGRGIPLSNTNQLWGLAWGALVFGEFAHHAAEARLLIIAGSLIMIGGAVAISLAEASESEKKNWQEAIDRECERYGLDRRRMIATLEGHDPLAAERPARRWWELGIVGVALALFVWLGAKASFDLIPIHGVWAFVLIAASVGILVVCGVKLAKSTRFS